MSGACPCEVPADSLTCSRSSGHSHKACSGIHASLHNLPLPETAPAPALVNLLAYDALLPEPFWNFQAQIVESQLLFPPHIISLPHASSDMHHALVV